MMHAWDKRRYDAASKLQCLWQELEDKLDFDTLAQWLLSTIELEGTEDEHQQGNFSDEWLFE